MQWYDQRVCSKRNISVSGEWLKSVEVTELKVGVPHSFAWWLLIRRSLEFDGHDAVNRIDGNLKLKR